jgi:recombinational DNA repair ATPase RecF
VRLIQLKALNFMKFHKVDLVFPEKGLFCIQGANESGKSTVGHLIFFALSGMGSKGETPESLINWEKSQMKVKISFYHNTRKYQLLRQVDRDGSNFSKLARGSEVLAQGNTAIAEVLKKELGYAPRDLQRSFLVTHRIVQNLVYGPALEHLNYMLGLEHFTHMIKDSEVKVLALEKTLGKDDQEEKRLKDELRSLVYDETEKEAIEKLDSELIGKRNHLASALEISQNESQSLTRLQEQFEKIEQSLPSKLDERQTEALPRTLTKVLEELPSLSLKECCKEGVEQVTSSMNSVLSFLRGRGEFIAHYEARLEALRSKIGLKNEEETGGPPEGSLSYELAFLKNKISKRQTWATRWGVVCGGLFLLTVFLFIELVFFWNVVNVVNEFKVSGIAKFFESGIGLTVAQYLGTWMEPGPWMGLPMDPRPWAIFALFATLTLVVMVLAIRSSSSGAKCDLQLKELEKRRDDLKSLYHRLLSVDIKDMSEVYSVLTDCEESKLVESFEDLKKTCPKVAEAQYNLQAMMNEAKGQFKRMIDQLVFKFKDQQKKCSELESIFAEGEGDLEQNRIKLEEVFAKEARYISLEDSVTSIIDRLASLKDQRNVKCYLVELAEGTLNSVRERLRRDLTLAYKELMPKITEDRYSSIRLNEKFGIEVFSEDRGDFVPLHQLSSGTNDLFVLMFQIILLQGFMSARQHDQHFLFLDEPLLAVDGVRYQKLTDLLPEMCDGLQQVFLCRPPQDQKGTMEISTELNAKELVSDLSLAREDTSFD